MTTLLSPAAWARRSAAHPWRVVAAWAGALLVSIAIVATLLSSALTTEQTFVSNPESKRAATAIELRQGNADRIVESVVIQPASPAAQAAVIAAVTKDPAVKAAQAGPSTDGSSLVQIVLRKTACRRTRTSATSSPPRRPPPRSSRRPRSSPARRRSTTTSRRSPRRISRPASRSASRSH